MELQLLADKIRELLYEVIQEQLSELENESKLSIGLSGGIDSTVVAYLLKKFWKRDLEAFTVHVEGFNSDERDIDHATRVANHFNLKHTIINASKNEVLQSVEPVIKLIIPEGRNLHDYNVYSGIVTYLLGPVIKSAGINVCFGGEGFDELSGSYGPSGSFQKTHDEMATVSMRQKLYYNLTQNGYLDRTTNTLGHFGVSAQSPYINDKFRDLMLSIPDKYFTQTDWKLPLIAAFEKEIPVALLRRKKVRAQVGSGVFELLQTEGYNQEKLQNLYLNKA
jgi:asparagine synthetase B (glutamine-hydrolysing)